LLAISGTTTRWLGISSNMSAAGNTAMRVIFTNATPARGIGVISTPGLPPQTTALRDIFRNDHDRQFRQRCGQRHFLPNMAEQFK